MKRHRLLRAWPCVCALIAVHAIGTTAQRGRPASLPLSVNAPAPAQFDVALDEIEVEWTGGSPARSPRTPSNTSVMRVHGKRTVLAVSGLTTLEGLGGLSRTLASENPGAEVSLVLYEPGSRDESSRALLTARVALLLADPDDPTES